MPYQNKDNLLISYENYKKRKEYICQFFDETAESAAKKIRSSGEELI